MFATGHVKRNPATGEVALRTHFPEDDAQLAYLAWTVVGVNVGARNAGTSDVSSWEDLFTPTEGLGS